MNNIPPKLFERNEYGLLKNTEYVFNEDGTINWRKMIPVEFLVANKMKTSETDVTKLKDNELIILLGGLKHLASIRGYSHVKTQIQCSSPEHSAVLCEITWIPNYETEGREIIYSSAAAANLQNVSDFGRYYLTEMAENRAFARVIRNFLKINIVSDKELNDETKGIAADSSEVSEIKDERTKTIEKLQKLMLKKNLMFEDVKTKLMNENVENAGEFTSISDIPTGVLIDLLLRFNKKDKKS